MNQFIYLGINISSTENYVNICLAKVWTAIDRLSIIWKFDRSDKIKQGFFQAAMPILLYGCTICMLTKYMEKKLVGNFTLNNSPWNSSYTATHLPSYKPPKIRWTRLAGHCWRIKGEQITNVLLWTPARRHAIVGQPAKT